MSSGTSTLVAVHGHRSGLLTVIALVALVLLFAIDAGGVLIVVRWNRRLTRPGRVLVGIVSLWTIVVAAAVFVQELRPGDDWGGALVSTAFIVLYGLIGCGVVFLADPFARQFRRRVIA